MTKRTAFILTFLAVTAMMAASCLMVWGCVSANKRVEAGGDASADTSGVKVVATGDNAMMAALGARFDRIDARMDMAEAQIGMVNQRVGGDYNSSWVLGLALAAPVLHQFAKRFSLYQWLGGNGKYHFQETKND